MASTYEPPSLQKLLTAGSFIYILNVAGSLLDRLIHAGLLGQIVAGIIYGPSLSSIIPSTWTEALTALGYVGLVLIVFEGTDCLPFPRLH